MSPDHIEASHAATDLAAQITQAQDARYRAEDEARRAAQRDPRQEAIKAATSLAKARPTKGTTPPGKGPARGSQPRIRPTVPPGHLLLDPQEVSDLETILEAAGYHRKDTP